MSPVGFEPTVSADERPKTYALDCAATGNGITWDSYRTEFLVYYTFRFWLVHDNKNRHFTRSDTHLS
jgi:hypothetical protein